MSFDSSHIWETGIQTYLAGLQHLPISQSPSSTASFQPAAINPESALTGSNFAQQQQIVPTGPVGNSQPVAPIPQRIAGKASASRVASSPPVAPTPDKIAVHSAPDTQTVAKTSQRSSQLLGQIDSDEVDSTVQASNDLASSVARKMYLCLAAHNGSALDSFLQAVADPSEWEVFVWQAPESSSRGAAAHQYLEVATRWQGEVSQFVSFTQPAGDLAY